MRKPLGVDYAKRRYWAVGGRASAWRIFVEEEGGSLWGWYEGTLCSVASSAGHCCARDAILRSPMKLSARWHFARWKLCSVDFLDGCLLFSSSKVISAWGIEASWTWGIEASWAFVDLLHSNLQESRYVSLWNGSGPEASCVKPHCCQH